MKLAKRTTRKKMMTMTMTMNRETWKKNECEDPEDNYHIIGDLAVSRC